MHRDDAIYLCAPVRAVYAVFYLYNNLKPRAIEPCKSEVLTLYHLRDTRRRKGVIKLQVGLRVSYGFTLSTVTEKYLRL